MRVVGGYDGYLASKMNKYQCLELPCSKLEGNFVGSSSNVSTDVGNCSIPEFATVLADPGVVADSQPYRPLLRHIDSSFLALLHHLANSAPQQRWRPFRGISWSRKP